MSSQRALMTIAAGLAADLPFLVMVAFAGQRAYERETLRELLRET